MKQAGFPLTVKRILDVAAALSGLALGAPLGLAIAVAVRIGVGSPVLFRQMRGGAARKPFELIKFKTMTDERDADGNLLPDVRRLNRVGRLLRNYSLDELPQLWNVLRGDMSLVGPRPLLARYLDRYNAEQSRRQDVMPGLTGWCQINGRNALSWEEKFALDVWYVDNWSLWLDAKIVLMTFVTVLRGSGVSHGRYATMPEFLGYDGTVIPSPEYRDLMQHDEGARHV